MIPFLGAGANLCGRPEKASWSKGRFLPKGSELAKVLADECGYPVPDDDSLLRVSQYVGAVLGEGALYEYLRDTFDADYPPTPLHEFLADLARPLRAERPLLILTTNYDDALERAFAERREPFEVLWYEAKKSVDCGRFLHRVDGEVVVVDKPNEYLTPALLENTVILKLHGAIDREDPKRDSYVITEDDYIDYLSRPDISKQIPITLRQRMEESHYLFLGYSLRDWNLRVVLNRIWGEQTLDLKSWAVQREDDKPGVSEIEQKLWQARGDVDVVYVPLDEYVERLKDELQDKEPGAKAA
ncbi:MAG TPA: SIR2 family protein [Solirubrobacteraceae bacterium]|nr:SIR2 family protein [Solirubrobacteraceae bacterium]